MKLRALQTWILVGCIALEKAKCLHALATTPCDVVDRYGSGTNANHQRLTHPLASTVLLVSDTDMDDSVVFRQTSIGQRLDGAEVLKRTSQQWDSDFQSDIGVCATIGRISTISQDVMLVKWNVTWVPPTTLWLEGIGKALGPKNVELVYVTYNHLS